LFIVPQIAVERAAPLQGDVVVIGDADTDIFLEVPRIPNWDEGVLAEKVSERAGGKGANTAAALSRLGTSTAFFGCIGDDRYGERAAESLRRHNVDLDHLITIEGGSTYYCIILLDPTGEKAMVVVRTPITYPTPAMLQEQQEYLLAARHVHAIGLKPEAVSGALSMLKAHNRSVSIDLDSAPMRREVSEALARQATIVFLNQQGAEALFPAWELEQVGPALLALGPEVVVITRGGRGSIAFRASEPPVAVDSFTVDVKDTTGAGDCFSAAFIHGYLRQWPLRQTLVFASAAAALSTRAIGAQEALGTEGEVLAFLEDQDAKI
jgi:sugar/nucleoside kinase (ribokinase family)